MADSGISPLKGKISQSLAAFVATLGIFSLGSVLGWTSSAFPSMAEQQYGYFVNITMEEKSWIGSIATLGALAGCPIAGIGIEKFGRKRTMLFYSIPFTLGWILISYASNITLMYAGRFLTGLCGGVFSLAAPVYISETAEDHIRGRLASMFQISLVCGILFTYILGTFVSWKMLAISCSFISVAFIILMLFIPESPRYLLSQERTMEAEKSMCWFRGAENSLSVQEELASVQQSINESRRQNTRFKDLFKPTILKPLIISLYLVILQQLCGFNAVIFYTNDIFKAAGTPMDTHFSTIIVGSVQVLATFMSAALVDKAGRRILLLFSEIIMTVSLVILGAFFYIKRIHGGVAPHYFGWLPLFSLALFVVAFSVGIGPLSWTVMGEILPPNSKGLCSAIATSVVWFSAFVVTKCYENLLEAIGIDNTFWLFAGCCFVGAIIVYFFVPETKGKSLDEIQVLFSKLNEEYNSPAVVYVNNSPIILDNLTSLAHSRESGSKSRT